MFLQLVTFAQFSQNVKNVSFGLQRNTPRALKYLPQYFFTEKTIRLLQILKKTFVSVSLKFESYAYLAKIESGIKIKAVLARAQIIFNFC